ncbi:MAG: hypothetical protein KA004_19260 [Verrucomicrobiales bacterium]|nr:hypothetical protein [Verrucomicrobiales bacterium]
MSALTLAFPCDHSAAGVLLFGPDVPIHEQIEKVQRWAATETTPLAGTARLEIWTSQGVRTRVSIPVSAPLAEDAPPPPVNDSEMGAALRKLAEEAARVPQLETELANLSFQLQETAAAKGALSAAVENLTRQLNAVQGSGTEPESEAPKKKK